MADAATSECEQCGVAVLNQLVHDQWHRGVLEPRAHDSSATSSPPSWWQQWAAAHDLEQALKRNHRNSV